MERPELDRDTARVVYAPPGPRSTWLNLPFPLIGGGMAMLYVPIPLSPENYDYLTRLLATTLEGMREAIVQAADKPPEPAA